LAGTWQLVVVCLLLAVRLLLAKLVDAHLKVGAG
jgi:hypothetical protein